MITITFQGKPYLLVGTLEEGGAIATPEDYSAGHVGYAHLYEDGVVRQFGRQIGTREDIAITGTVPDPALEPDAFANVLEQLSYRYP